MPTLPPYLVHHSFSEVQSTQPPPGNQSLCQVEGQSETTGELHHICRSMLSQFRIQSPVRVNTTPWIPFKTKEEKQRRSRMRCRSAESKTSNWYSSSSTVYSQPNVLELWLDTPRQCTQSTSFIRQHWSYRPATNCRKQSTLRRKGEVPQVETADARGENPTSAVTKHCW